MPRTLITVCTYNEADNLRPLAAAIREAVPNADILVMDDSSPDGTGEIADELSAKDSQIHAFHRTERGLGTATITAFRWGLEHDYEIIANLDADFSHPPDRLPALVEEVTRDGGPDVAIGSRYVPGGSVRGWPPLRHVMSRCINWYTRWLFGLKARDCSGSFRAYRVEMLRRIDWDAFLSTGYSVQEELLERCRRAGASITELPISFVDRRRGQSKIDFRESWTSLRILWRLRGGRG